MSNDERSKGVAVIQIVKVGHQFSVQVRGNLSSHDINYGLDLVKLELLQRDRQRIQPSLDLKVRQMP